MSNQETVIETSGGTAEAGTGGVRLNMIPRDGANQFSGGGYLGGSTGGWKSDNFTQRLRDMGVTAVSGVDAIWDYSATVGGPIVKDRMWFHFTAREVGQQLPVADSYYNDGRQYSEVAEMQGLAPRITWQVTPRNKFTAHVERLGRITGPTSRVLRPVPGRPPSRTSRGADPETATDVGTGERPYGAWYVKWSSPVSSRLLLEAGGSRSFTSTAICPGGRRGAALLARLVRARA